MGLLIVRDLKVHVGWCVTIMTHRHPYTAQLWLERVV